MSICTYPTGIELLLHKADVSFSELSQFELSMSNRLLESLRCLYLEKSCILLLIDFSFSGRDLSRDILGQSTLAYLFERCSPLELRLLIEVRGY